jgi:hypothetical protein
MAYIGFLGAGLLMVLSIQMKQALPAMILMGLASFCNDLVMPPSWAACMDIGGKYAASAHVASVPTKVVHNGAMAVANKTVRQSVTLPATVAAQVRTLAKGRRLSANRMLVELIENAIEAEKAKQQEFFRLAERFRAATDSEEAKRLGDQLGRMVFGG